MKTKNIESKLLRRTEMHKHKLEEKRDKKEHSPYTPTFIGMGLVTVVCFMLLFVGIGVASAADYYVATGGNDSNPGTLNEPWQHPSHAAQQARAGDTIYLMDGTWYREQVEFANSGTAGSPITMTAYSGTPTLDGVDKTIRKGISTGGHSHIHINGLKVINYEIYNMCVGSGSSYIHISNCYFAHAAEQLVRAAGSGSHHITLENCTIHSGGWNLVQIRGKLRSGDKPCHHISIINNHIYDAPGHCTIDLFGGMDDIEIIGNYIHNEMAGDAYQGIYTHGWDPYNVRHRFTIKNNHIHNYFRGIGISHIHDVIISNNNIHDTTAFNLYGIDCSDVSGCGNIFDKTARVDTTDDGRLTAEDFTDPCAGDVGTISGTVTNTTDTPISGATVSANGYKTTTE